MKDEIIDILWDFARSVAKTTLNPHLNYASSAQRNKELATKAYNDIIMQIKQHEPTIQRTKDPTPVG